MFIPKCSSLESPYCVGHRREPSASKKLGKYDFQESSGQGKSCEHGSHFQDVLSKYEIEDLNL